jgi:hypothetical protein
MRSRLSLAFLLALLVLPSISCFAQSLTEAKEIIKELLTINQELTTALKSRDQQLTTKDQQLTDALTLLGMIKVDNQTLKTENWNLTLYWESQKKLEIEQQNSLIARQNERDIFIGVAGLLALGWLVDRAFIR